MKFVLIVCVIILIILLISRKTKGLQGSWDSKKDIEEFAIIMGGNDVYEKNINNEQNTKTMKAIQSKYIPTTFVKKTNDSESLGEKICRDHLSTRFNTSFVNKRPNFLKNNVTNRNLELDCFSEKLKLALEYNGKQHYEFIPKFHNSKADFFNQKYRDDIKRRLCMENGIDLIEVPYTVNHQDIPLYIDNALEKLGRIKLV